MLSKDIKSFFDLLEMFPTEQSCIDYLEELWWSGIPVSPFDKESKVYKCKNNRYKCTKTNKYFTVRTGTMYEQTKIDLRKWFFAQWLVTSEKKGLTSIRLAEHIGVSQRTAWFMLQRIRACYGIENNNELEGVVEADESFYGGKNKNRHKNKRAPKTHGRAYVDKTPIVGMVQRGGKMTAVVVENTKIEELTRVVSQFVKPGSTLITDDWSGYNGVSHKYEHRVIKEGSKRYLHAYDPETHTNQIEGAWKIMKNSLRDMYNHVSRKHLQKYVDEFVFRYNMRNFHDSDKFNHLLANSQVRTKYKFLVHGTAKA